MSGHWEDALAEQVKLLRFWRSDLGREYADGFSEDVARKGRPSAAFFRGTPMMESHKLERAEPVYVDENVVDLVAFAADQVRPEPLQPEDLFCQEGFALLPKPIYLEDVHGKVAAFRAFSWGPLLTKDSRTGHEEAQLHVVLYAHWADDDDYSPSLRAELRRKMGVRNEDEFGAVWRSAWGGCDLSMYHAAILPWGRVPDYIETIVGDRPVLPEEGPGADKAAHTLWKFIQTFFRLAQQEVTAPTRTHGDRHARKRLRRLREDKDGVLVVRLRRERRPKPEDDAIGEVEWSCQWPVSGHWRNQWYPTLGEHRQIWIGGYIKGPEDKPLRIHAGRAFEFTR